MDRDYQQTDVLIVGGGVAGPALACALRDTDLTITLIEKSDEPADTARGDHLQPRTCEILQRWGVLADLFQRGAEKRSGAIWLTKDGEVLMNSSIADLPVPHPYFAFLNHEKISETLIASAARSPTFEMIRPIRNWWLEKSPERRKLVRITLTDGSERYFSAAMLVGADGRASRTRKFAEIESESRTYDNPISVLFADNLDSDPTNSVRVFLSDNCMVSVIPRTGGGCKIGVPMPPTEVSDWRKADNATLEKRLGEIVPALKVANVRFGDAYPPIFLQTGAWVNDNIVLIGDACHAMHPARSQGMNIAIGCIDELAARLSHESSPLDVDKVAALLADYEAQVKPRIDPLLAENHRSGLEMDDMKGERHGKIVESILRLQSNPAALHQYSMNAAGYPDPSTGKT